MHTSDAHGRKDAKTLSPQERRTIFARMVRMEVEQGPLRYARRGQLVRFATDIGINRVEAGRIIADARRSPDQPEPIALGPWASQTWTSPRHWPRWMKISLAIGLGLLTNLLLIRYLSGPGSPLS